MRGQVVFEFTKDDYADFTANLHASIRNVARGTKTAMTEAASTIMEWSKAEVPTDTLTLLASAYYEVRRRTDTAQTTWAYEAELGYGGNGDPVNPKTGQPASSYMVAVHERLDVFHPNGKAKFFEDPLRRYADGHWDRVVFKHAQESLASLSG